MIMDKIESCASFTFRSSFNLLSITLPTLSTSSLCILSPTLSLLPSSSPLLSPPPPPSSPSPLPHRSSPSSLPSPLPPSFKFDEEKNYFAFSP